MIKKILSSLMLSLCTTLAAGTLNLAGEWRFQLDPQDEGVAAQWWNRPLDDSIALPNTTSGAGKGNPLTLEPALDKTSLQHLHQKFSYVGPAWYRRSVEIPADWRDQDVALILERVIWETQVWINGQPVGMQDSLSTPHRHELGAMLKPGKNEIVIRVDNRQKLEIGIGHAYTDETQTIWNGVIGRIALVARDPVRIEHLQLRPSLARDGVEVTLAMHNGSGLEVTTELSLRAEAQNFRDDPPGAIQQTITLKPGDTSQTIFYPMGRKFERWSEFNPKLYRMRATLAGANGRSEITDTFGMREFKAEGRQFTINGRQTFLRGTLECCIFPETAHPAMEDAKWEKIFSTARSYGLNHLRFHSWCPPEAAFRVADRHGFYLQVELPNWSSKMGQVPAVDEFFRREGERMIREYGNHPSWVMFSMGNELLGDFAKVDELVAHFKQLDPQLLYTSTSYSFAKGALPRGELPGPQDDYFISQKTRSGWVRGQGFLNKTPPNTVSDYSEGLACLKIPLVSHEVGQYNVYPDLAEMPKYAAGPLRPLGYEAIQADLEKKGRLADAPRYTRDSGKLAAVLYKEDIERALRTQDQAGIALLDLHDFPGQGTATVGLLDSFWDSKGLITPEQFRRFCNPTVPLIRMAKMIFQNDETFEAAVEIAHFGAAPITNATVLWTLGDGRQEVGRGEFKVPAIPLGNGIQLGRIRQPLSGVTHAAKLKVTVEIPGTAIGNDWSVWVYPTQSATPQTTPELLVMHGVNPETLAALAAGKRVLLLPPRGALKDPLPARFIPVFWSPLHFPDQPGTLGATIDAEHPLWRNFPTGTHTDWQWWELTAKSVALNLDGLDPGIGKPFCFVDKYNRNELPAAIFEANVGAGRLLVCTLDVESDPGGRIVARQLHRALLEYAASPEFQPRGRLTPAQLSALIGEADVLVKADSEYPTHPAELAVDGKPDTFWHSDWESAVKLPISITLDLKSAKVIEGFTYLPRQDMANGRIARYAAQVSLDGATWAAGGQPGEFANNQELQTVKFDPPIKARYLRLTALSDHRGKGYAGAAEIKVLLKEESDVRLGMVPGFHDHQ
ncbi:MAG TPA: discoidin domain-containing protein [Verrucomicrobiae bacterium]|nr:discoidin domain-containing protein [Verrucomicrobiae bacterium]